MTVNRLTGYRNNAKREIALLVSYRPIVGYETGIYEGTLIVVAGENRVTRGGHAAEAASYCQAQEIMRAVRKGTLDDLEIFSSVVGQIIIYSGLYAQKEALEFASDLKDRTGRTPELAICQCDLPYKVEFVEKMGVEKLLVSECTGSRTMGRIADHILGKTLIDPRTQTPCGSPQEVLKMFRAHERAKGKEPDQSG